MGNWASGNIHQQRRLTTDELPSIHIRDIASLAPQPEMWRPAPTDQLNLCVRKTKNEAEFALRESTGMRVIGKVGFSHSPRNCGGQQQYFQCGCGKQVALLYHDHSDLACRKCHGLLYPSQFESQFERTAKKARKLRLQIGAEPGLLSTLPDKPKHMRQQTFDSITYRLVAVELEALQELKTLKNEKWLPILSQLDQLN